MTAVYLHIDKRDTKGDLTQVKWEMQVNPDLVVLVMQENLSKKNTKLGLASFLCLYCR